MIEYYYEGNNRGSYDVLSKDADGNIEYIAEVLNEDNALMFLDVLIKEG